MARTQIRTDVLLVLILVQTVSKVISRRQMSKFTFSKNSLGNTIRVSNSLDQDQNQHSVDSDIGLNCLQRLSAYDKSHARQGKNLVFTCINSLSATYYLQQTTISNFTAF